MENEYFKKRNGSLYLDYTKDEIRAAINVDFPTTAFKFLEAMDYPFIPDIWAEYVEHCRSHSEPDSYVIGKYIARMNLAGFRKMGFYDYGTKNT